MSILSKLAWPTSASRATIFERQLGRWCKQYRAAETEVNPSIEALIQWLQKHCPEDDGQACLVHGDYRIDNVVFYPGQAKGQAVLDWELSTIGHPMADLAYFLYVFTSTSHQAQ